VNRKTPADWVWAYHVTPEEFLPSIAKEGLRPMPNRWAENKPVIFVEPDLDGVEGYRGEGIATLRFKTPGFGTTNYGESVLFAPDAPFVGKSGEDGVIPPERIQVLRGRRFGWLV
jgi:hypothetical protein